MKITTPDEAFLFFRTRLRSDVEEFWVASLDSDKNVTAADCLFRGTVDRCLFHPRDVFRFACVNNAAALVVAHNHPSGNVRPSDSDVEVTARLLDAAHLLELPVVDHLIVTTDKYFSFSENGLLRNLAGRVDSEPDRY